MAFTKKVLMKQKNVKPLAKKFAKKKIEPLTKHKKIRGYTEY